MAKTRVYSNGYFYNLSYELINPECENSILILHGWGANKELMKQAFSQVLKNFKQIYLDLPGFGNSSIDASMDSYAYAKVVKDFLVTIEQKIDYLMGHSFGGKIATIMCQNDDYKGLILLSSAGIVLPKSSKVRFKIALFKILKNLPYGDFWRKFFISKDAQGMSEIMYDTFKKVVNENLENEFQKIKNPILIFWGNEDKATPLKSGAIIHSLAQKGKLFSLEGDHFFFLKHAAFINAKIQEEFINND
ncbi:alpha/beta fold hydrolase [Campylobacter peloridis]|uniref:Alpha/beta hydrolase n=1 Tax=Campylobacter peloridis TaxID=488546 RepID=A0ABX6TTV4_9BACT|nr:alpha/beta hydrolase [Campylobacter peloridis]AJC84527.1 alpha/beta hydrolase family protein [Campylobacter peloridis LMG 23910]MBX1885760.1 alpha/beta hydrolase [Campylobacter peloridis]MBX2078886.1 alpha/beta hydrolase [Campylobacter peloridis]QOQ88599.1 alpha/beta hydrolase [Campylobacter peloridis]